MTVEHALGFGSDALEAELTACPLFQAIPAVRDDRVDISMLNIPWQLDRRRPVPGLVAAS